MMTSQLLIQVHPSWPLFICIAINSYSDDIDDKKMTSHSGSSELVTTGESLILNV